MKLKLVLAAVVAAVAVPGVAEAAPVNMQKVVLASQLDPYRIAGANTAGAKPSVKQVQKALNAQGIKTVVDGSFGPATMNAYAEWQRRNGASGLGANGIPGIATLTKLGKTKKARFTVTKKVQPMTRTTYDTKTVALRTKRMLTRAARTVGGGRCTLGLYQGSYSTSVDASAYTHAGGGAVDLDLGRLCGKSATQVVNALSRVGFAAWVRSTSQGFDVDHIHAIAIGDPDISTPVAFPGQFTAAQQIGAWAKNEDGLSSPGSGPLTRRIVMWEDARR